jgi:hypothetical protein
LRRRMLAIRRVHDALWTALATSTGAALGGAAALAVGGDALAGAAAAALLVVPFAIFALALWRHAHPLDALAVARWAESRASYQERLSTAIEHEGATGPIALRLDADAREHVARLDVARAAPWRLPVAPVAGLVASLAVLGVLSVWPRVAPGATTAPASDATDGAAAAADTLRELADLLAAEAQRSGDASLGALAEALRALADAAPDRATERVRREEMATLLDEVARVAGGPMGVQDLLERALREGDVSAGAGDAAGGAGDDPAADRASLPTLTSGAGTAPGYEDLFTRSEEWVDDDDRDAVFSAGGAPSTREAIRPTFDPEGAPDMPFAPAFEGPTPTGGAAEIIGAADQSAAGDSILAGRGSQALEGDPPAADFAEAEPDAVVLLGLERDEGRRIEVELPPPASWDAYDPQAFELGAWRARPEAPVSRDPTPLPYRAAAGRYFLPSQETSASR